MTAKTSYHILYLNGASSVGKSTLASALQEALTKPFLVFGIDQMISVMPDKMNDWVNGTYAPGFSWQMVTDERGQQALRVVSGPFGQKIIQALKDITVTLASSGQYLIIDDVSFGKAEVDAWRDALKDYKVLWVGVTAPIEIIEEREKKRGDRRIGGARWQAEHVHSGVTYDLMLDTYAQSLQDNVSLLKSYLE